MEDLAELIIEKLHIQQEVVVEEDLPVLPPPNPDHRTRTTDRRRLLRDKKIQDRIHLQVEDILLAFIAGTWTIVPDANAPRHLATFSKVTPALSALRKDRIENGYRILVGGEWICTLRKRDDVVGIVKALL